VIKLGRGTVQGIVQPAALERIASN
jgi:hypothetical protein